MESTVHPALQLVPGAIHQTSDQSQAGFHCAHNRRATTQPAWATPGAGKEARSLRWIWQAVWSPRSPLYWITEIFRVFPCLCMHHAGRGVA